MCIWENDNSHIKLEEPTPNHEDSIQATIKKWYSYKARDTFGFGYAYICPPRVQVSLVSEHAGTENL